MSKLYRIRFRRNGKERYWEVIDGASLYEFQCLLKNILEDTNEVKLEIIVEKTASGAKTRK